MTSKKTVWGLDVGRSALKAVELRDLQGKVELCAFELIEYPPAPSDAQADPRQLARDAIGQFLDRRDLSGCHVAVSTPGRGSCTRFVHLPPIESSRVPNLVRYEAAQQIPFSLDEAVWRWQTFRDLDQLDSPDVDAGIFAARRQDVGEMLLLFSETHVNVDTMQTAPLALYNFMKFSDAVAPDGATLLVDLGADDVDLVVADQRRIWTRTEPFGGRRFTEALAGELSLPFGEAETRKRSAPEGPHGEGIPPAMEAVSRELAETIRQCMDDYRRQHAQARFTRLAAAGGGFRLPGLRESVGQELGLPVVGVEPAGKVRVSASVGRAALGENAASLAVAYGLALQGLGLTPIHANFLPSGIAHRRGWSGAKTGTTLGRLVKRLLGRL